MQARELVELGAVVAAHGDLFVHDTELALRPHLEEYWQASRARQVRWQKAIRAYHRPPAGDAHNMTWQSVRPFLEEILTSELLTRIWTAVACARDHCRHANELGPIVRSVFVGHLEARNRALHVMVYGDGFTVEEGVVLNRLRRHIERWTDMLLGFLMKEHDVTEFAFNVRRCREFAADLGFDQGVVSDSPAARLVLVSLRAAFQSGISRSGISQSGVLSSSANADLNRQIAGSILSCFRHQAFDSVGMFKSLWALRLSRVTEETAGLIEDLIGVDDGPTSRISLRH